MTTSQECAHSRGYVHESMTGATIACADCGHLAVVRISETPPARGEVRTTIGDAPLTVTVVFREAPSLPGHVWAAPFAVNCSAHGWIVSRATWQEAYDAACAHSRDDFDTEQTARRIGSQHAYLERAPWDMDSEDSAALMTALGEYADLSESNAPWRESLCESYLDGYDAAAKALA